VSAVELQVGAMRTRVEAEMAEHGCTMKDLTVLAPQNDPFRVDTPARHRDGEWLAITAQELGLGDRRIHLRGLHYMLIGRPKPNGTRYTNTDADWLWLQGDCGKAARWLGYIPFDQIVDQRNAAPTIREYEPPGTPWKYVTTHVDVEIPDVDDLELRPGIVHFTGVQPYKLVMVGEKSSLDEVLAPIARRYEADLYLPTGEPSDTLLYRMAAVGTDDGRPMAVLYFSDADPSGWQMPLSVSRKLQALKEGFFPSLDFEVHRVALTPDQVREHELPSTPLKDTERRGDRWREAMGVEQTEIDALASLRPGLLRQLARDAIRPFYDESLSTRVSSVKWTWQEEAEAAIGEQVDGAVLDGIRQEAAEKLDGLRDEIEALNDQLRMSAEGLSLPPIPSVPDPIIDAEHPLPLLDSRWSFADQCRRLIDAMGYLP
jgi:hypothetical protein